VNHAPEKKRVATEASNNNLIELPENMDN